jgi:hypothetical protein
MILIKKIRNCFERPIDVGLVFVRVCGFEVYLYPRNKNKMAFNQLKWKHVNGLN